VERKEDPDWMVDAFRMGAKAVAVKRPGIYCAEMSFSLYLRRRFFHLVVAVLIANCAITAKGQDAPDRPPECAAYASVPLPAEAEKAAVPKTPPVCASYRSYRGIGRRVNYSEARACAWKERLAQKADLGQGPEGTAWVVGGSLILADIYVNGAGVKRNIPLAMRFACESEEGMAEGALPDIKKLDSSLPAHGPFEFCDYAATTFSETFCAGYASEIATDRRDRYFDSLKASMSGEQRAAFEKLLAAEHAYIEAHADEVDQGGSIHNIRTLGSQDILQDLFRTEVVRFARKEWPALTDDQIAKADGALHHEYEKQLGQLRAQPRDANDLTSVTADHVAGVEKVWDRYRDAWVAFARLRYPDDVARIRAEITLDRWRFLKTIS